MLNCKDVRVRNLGERRGGNELDRGKRNLFLSSPQWKNCQRMHPCLACGTPGKPCVSLTSPAVERSRLLESPWQWLSEEEERGGSAGTRVEIFIDLDETVAGEDDSLTQQRRQEHGGVRECKDSSEPGAF